MTGTLPALFLADTNILVHYARRSALYQRIEATYHLTQSDPPPLISIVTRGEILSLAVQFGWGQRRRQELDRFVRRCTTVNLDYPGLLEAYAEMDAYSLAIGRKLGDNDLWIAATAKVTGALLLTTDKDFDHLHSAFIQRDWIDPKMTS